MSDEYWEVTVIRNGHLIAEISSNHVIGCELTAEDEACIRNCAEHLLSFVGREAVVLEEAKEGDLPF
jgi:hypothetical protein